MKYIMTGTEGMIGHFLDERLQERGNKRVLAIDNRTGFNLNNLDTLKLNPQTQHTDFFFHLAAHCKINEGTENPELPHKNNADGTFQALEFCRRNKIKRFVNFSSSRVLSHERNPYVASKIYGEELVRAHGDCYGLEWATVRPSTVYGPQHDVTSRLITTWCQNALRGKALPIFGDEDKTLDFTHVDDFVDGVEMLVDEWTHTNGNAYNISGGTEVNLTDLAHMVMEEAGAGFIEYRQPEIAQPQKVSVDIDDMRQLGYEPKVSIQDGVRQMVHFYRDRRHRVGIGESI